MMRVFIAYCVLLGVLQIKASPISDNQKLILRAFHKDCLEESKVDGDFIDKARKGVLLDDPSFKNYIYCFSTRLGFLDDNNAIQKDTIKKRLSNLIDDEALLTKILEQCPVQKSTPQETTFYIAKCIKEIAPNLTLYKPIIHVGNEKAQQLLLAHKDCAERDILDEHVIEQALKKGIIVDDPKFKNYIYCISRKQGYQREDGSIDKEVFEKGLGHVIDDPAVVRKLAEQCAQKQEAPEDTSLFMSKCVHENSPVYVDFFPREITVPEEDAKRIIENARACIKETKVDRDILKQARQGIYQEDPKLKEFSFCMAKKAGVINDAGEIQKDILKEKTLKIIDNLDIVNKLVDKCAIKMSQPVDTAFRATICFQKNSPGHFSITQFSALSHEQVAKRKEVIKNCSEEFGVSRSQVLSARKGNFQEDDPLLKEYLLCVSKKFGILTEAGEYNKDVMRERLSEMFNAMETERIIEKCAKNQDDPLKTSFVGFKCFYNEAPEAPIVF